MGAEAAESQVQLDIPGEGKIIDLKTRQEIHLPSLRLSKSEKISDGLIDDEYNSQARVLKPIQHVSVTIEDYQGKRDISYDDKIAKALEYYSQTRSLEVGTLRTQVLQQIADTITDGMNIQTRVVIMNKGMDATAFVLPDGTIVISQTCINKLGSLDEISAVIAHEILHLKNRTFQKRVENKEHEDIKKLGVGWIHEAASDLGAPALLAKAKLNSQAFGIAIEKIQGTSRGVEHQGGLMRASESVALHQAIDFPTSNKPLTSIPEALQQEAKMTNIELLKNAIYRKNVSQFKVIIGKLHRWDLENVKNYMFNILASDSKRRFKDAIAMSNSYFDLLGSRLKASGYSSEEAKLFCFFVQSKENYAYETIGSPEELVAAAKNLHSFKQRNLYTTMFRELYDQDDRDIDHEWGFIERLEHHYFDIESYPSAGRIPVTKDTFLETLGIISRANVNPKITYLLLNYIEEIYLAGAGDEPVDEEQIRMFFQEAIDAGITVTPSCINDRELMVRNHHLFYQDWRDDGHLSKNQQTARKIFIELFGEEKIDYSLDLKLIDSFFEPFETQGNYPNEKAITGFIKDIEKRFAFNKLSDSERAKYIDYIGTHIDKLHYTDNFAVINIVDPYFENGDQDTTAMNQALVRFNTKLIMAVNLFGKDGDEFYSYVTKLMDNSFPDVEIFSKLQIFNLCQPLLCLDKMGSYNYYGSSRYGPVGLYTYLAVKVENWERFTDLPLLKMFRERQEPLEINNLQELNEYIRRQQWFVYRDQDSHNVFSDQVGEVLFSQEIRNTFLNLVKKGIPINEYDQLFYFTANYLPRGTERDGLLRLINLKYLHAGEVSINAKTQYLVDNFDQVGFEGMQIVAEQITDLASYRKFREKISDKLEGYLEGSWAVTKIAAIDVVSSFFTQNFADLLDTCKDTPEGGLKSSTFLAKEWAQKHFGKIAEKAGVIYDPNTNQFKLNHFGREIFTSFADVVTFLKNLSHLQRTAIIQKALTDVNGAFTSLKNREQLAKILVSSLGLKPGFLSQSLTAACRFADGKIVSFPLANMLAPLLFQNLDVNAVNVQEVIGTAKVISEIDKFSWDKKEVGLNTYLSAEDLASLLKLNSREAAVFGANFQNHPQSEIALIVQDSDRVYHGVLDELHTLLTVEKTDEKSREKPTPVDPSLEAVIKGVQACGTMGQRNLQLASQFHRFSPEVDRRLSESLDDNPGIDKLRLWENLHLFCQEDRDLKTFIEKCEIFEQLGKGSMFTTRAAVLTEADGTKRDIVIKVLNPNALATIEQTHQVANTTLEDVAKHGTRLARSLARTAQAVNNLVKVWCSLDIKDPNFLEADASFCQTIAGFNVELGEETFYAPEVLYSSMKVKAEERAKGITLNTLLKDSSVDSGIKKSILQKFGHFFAYQLRKPFTDEQGRKYYLLHSDPHVGNYVIDTNGQLKIGVIDRSMYLKLSEEDINISDSLVKGRDYRKFLNGLINRVLDINNIRDRSRRSLAWMGIWAAVGKEYGSQRLGGGVNNFSLLQTVLTKLPAELTQLSPEQVNVPLVNLRLMIKNIGSVKKTLESYGLSL